MKKIIAIIGLLNCFQFFAQQTVPVENFGEYNYATVNDKYFKDVNSTMDKFLGNWVYINGNKRVDINIYKNDFVNTGGGYYNDELYIEFKYTENDVEVFNTMDQDEKYLISGEGYWWPGNTNKYRFLYLEPGQVSGENYQYLVIEYIAAASGEAPHLSWNVHLEPKTEYPALPQMPLQMIFTKQ